MGLSSNAVPTSGGGTIPPICATPGGQNAESQMLRAFGLVSVAECLADMQQCGYGGKCGCGGQCGGGCGCGVPSCAPMTENPALATATDATHNNVRPYLTKFAGPSRYSPLPIEAPRTMTPGPTTLIH